MKRLTPFEFIERARQVHGDKYDYSNIRHVYSAEKVIIICPSHGEFQQRPSNHLRGQGCSACSGKRKKTTAQFVEEALQTHGNKYNYDKVEYINNEKKVVITCPIHGDFEQSPYKHLVGQGCSACSVPKQFLIENFIEKARQIHGNKYRYDKVEYIDKDTKITIACLIHGNFQQLPKNHLKGQGCPSCSGNKKKTTEKFVEEAKKLHGNRYKYDKVKYIGNKHKVIIVCPIHGEFEQTPNNHLKGQGCLACGGSKRLTTVEFVKKAKNIHKNKYKYDNVEYINSHTKIAITCPIHGDFQQWPNDHLKGHGCLICSGSQKLSTEKFIEKSKKVHGDKYIYDKIYYINGKTKVIITCPIHGEFEQKPNSHLTGNGCMECSGNTKKTTERFIEEAKKVHGNKYKYDKVKYIGNKYKVIIICPIHGEFEQSPVGHLSGYGCLSCSGSEKKTTPIFIEQARMIHGEKYTYDKVHYVNSKTKVLITCPFHGDFEQIPNEHINSKKGCPKCRISKGEAKIESCLESMSIRFIEQFTFDDCIYKRRLPFDFAIFIDNEIGLIEYQGEQHYCEVAFYKDVVEFEECKKRDSIKAEYAKMKNIPLLIIPYSEYDNIKKKFKIL